MLKKSGELRQWITGMSVGLLVIAFFSLLGFSIYEATKDHPDNRPNSTVTCQLGKFSKVYKNVKVHTAIQSWVHDLFFTYQGKEVTVQDTYCIIETAKQ